MIETSFKNSEVGRIPEEWIVLPFHEIFDVIRNGCNYNTRNTKGYPMCRIETMSKGVINYDLVGYAMEEPVGYKMQLGDILFSHINSLPYIGKVAYYKAERTLYHGMNVLLLRANKNYDSKCLYYQLSSSKMKTIFEGIAKPAINQASISTKELGKILCILPKTIKEQKRIAETLSNIDFLITQLKNLIEKKKAIKQGTMRELLTGKRRLKGFTEPWVEITLRQVGEAIRGVSFNPNQSSTVKSPNYIPLLRSNNITDDRICYDGIVYVLEDCISLKQIMRDGDILICAANGSRRLVGKSGMYHEEGKCTFGAFMCVFRCSSDYNTDYIGYLMQSSQYKKQLEEILTGSAINNLNGSQIETLHFTISTDIKEQRAIASVLQNMDNEIDQLIIKRSKYIAIKQGMMQQLLTGKIRLI